jgi:RNA recognition motif-containing protein
MSNNIYVGNISWSATEEDLQDLFSEFGEVTSARIIFDRQTNRSKGFGFVEMAEADAASAAIDALNGKEMMGRNIKVNISEPNNNRRRNSY